MTPWEQVSVTVFCAVLASSGLWSIILFRMQKRERELEKKANKETVECRALKALLHDRIYAECTEAIGEGSIKPDTYNNLRYMFEPYVELGGNGTAKKLMNAVEKLPLDVEREVSDE